LLIKIFVNLVNLINLLSRQAWIQKFQRLVIRGSREINPTDHGTNKDKEHDDTN